jgi:hypothetical protein
MLRTSRGYLTSGSINRRLEADALKPSQAPLPYASHRIGRPLRGAQRIRTGHRNPPGVLAEDPTGEEAHACLMRVYALSNRRHEAILQYERLRKSLPGEPAAEVRRLYERILAGSLQRGPSPSGSRVPVPSARHPARHNVRASLTGP